MWHDTAKECKPCIKLTTSWVQKVRHVVSPLGTALYYWPQIDVVGYASAIKTSAGWPAQTNLINCIDEKESLNSLMLEEEQSV